MNINLTLLGQMITFALFVWFTMRFVWPPITKALQDRQKQIANGLAASEQSVRELELAQHKAAEQLREAKAHAASIIEHAHKHATNLLDEAKEQARIEGERLLQFAQAEIAREVTSAKQQLREQVVTIALASAEKILGRRIDAAANQDLIEQMVEQI